jgi:hypothetical protein
MYDPHVEKLAIALQQCLNKAYQALSDSRAKLNRV